MALTSNRPPFQAHEEEKGKYTVVADDMTTVAAAKQSALLSRVTYDQRGADERHQVRLACLSYYPQRLGRASHYYRPG